MSKGGGSTSSTTKVEVPEYLEDELKYGLEEARRLYDVGAPEYYPDQTYANLDPVQLEALKATEDRARSGSPLVSTAQDLTQKTMEGAYLEGNPYLDNLLQTYGQKAATMATGSSNVAGRMGSGSNVATATNAVTDATLPYLFQNYENERGRQVQASQYAPSLAQGDYSDISALMGVGDINQAQEQQEIDDAISRYSYDIQGEGSWLDSYLSRVNQSGSNQLVTQTQTDKESGGGGLGQALGTALSIGAMFVPGGQFAALGTAVGGGLSSALGGFGSQAIGGLMSASPTGPYLPYGLCDIRTKENIKLVGDKNGFNLYEFNYIGNDKKYIGPIAQEIEKTMPEAVKEFNGIKFYNQEMTGIQIVEAP